jgi:hypothetical protein
VEPMSPPDRGCRPWRFPHSSRLGWHSGVTGQPHRVGR